MVFLSSALRRTRQHHAVEHATIHLLSARHPNLQLGGLSDPWGFTLYGDIPEFEVSRAVSDALLRLQAGEESLAIHPNCGTNLTTTTVLVTAAALVATAGRREFLEKLAVLLLLILLALLAAQPLGLRVQQATTSSDVSDRWLREVSRVSTTGTPVYRVVFE